MLKRSISGATISLCWPVSQFLFLISAGYFSNSAMTGAILMASGRVPKTVSTLSMFAFRAQLQQICVEEIFHRPTDFPARYILRALAVATEQTAAGVLYLFQITDCAIRAFLFSQRIPDDRILVC